MKSFKELVKEAWGSNNPKVPFKGEYEVEFHPDSVNKASGDTDPLKGTHSAFYVDHDGGDKPGQIYVKCSYGEGKSNVDEKKFIVVLKKHLAAAKKAGEGVKVEVM